MEDYYQKYHRAYYERTSLVNPSPFLSPLLEFLPPGSTILDIGCGSGRDMLWLKGRGFKVIGLERSAGLAGLAREHIGMEIIEADFETYDLSAFEPDAIISVGSLVHIPHERMPGLLTRITSPLKMGGKVLLTLKEGEGSRTDDFGRIFYFWRDEDLQPIFADIGFGVLDFKRQTSAIREHDAWLGYVLEKHSTDHK
jgi:cyclopropane fatty-acyl-phospholipid synthase-like methyltransferase